MNAVVSIAPSPAAHRPSLDRTGTISVARIRRGLHHLIVFQRVRGVPGLVVPVVYVAEPVAGGGETIRPLEALIEFFKIECSKSSTWMLEHARGVGMLYDYLIQRGPALLRKAEDRGRKPQSVAIEEFFTHLYRGTASFGPDALQDETGLQWLPRSRDSAIKLAAGVTDLLGYVANQDDKLKTAAALGATEMPRSGAGMVGFVSTVTKDRALGLLAHLGSKGGPNQALVPTAFGSGMAHLAAADTVQFPRKLLAPLLVNAFSREDGEDTLADATARLLTAVCAVGGTRSSEGCHLWTSDIQGVDGNVEVFLRHPSKAVLTTATGETMTRAAYLNSIGMHPRTSRLAGKSRVGWKGIACNAQHWTVLYPVPVEGAADFLSEELLHYLAVTRPRIMRRRAALGLPDHPFLLVSCRGTDRHGNLTWGDPYTPAAYRSAWSRGIARLAKEPGNERLTVLKAAGTTPHGLRHLYGSLLREAGLTPEQIQRCMHHLSPLSQQTYTAPRLAEINAMLNAAAARTGANDVHGDFKAFRGTNELLDDLRAVRGGRRR